MRHLRLIGQFVRASFQEETAYRSNLYISLVYSLLNLVTGVLGITVLFSQVETINGWSRGGTLALLGVYLTAGALRSLFIGPSLEALAGIDGEVWTGQLDFTLLRPVDTQFFASLSKWQVFSFFDLVLGMGVVATAITQLGEVMTVERLVVFLVTLGAGIVILYAILLAFAGLVFWSPGLLFTWIFDGLFQMARYPLGLYPGWLQLALTWVIPVGIITTVPAQALTGTLSNEMLAGSLGLAVVLAIGASLLFRFGLRRYTSASS